MVSFPVFSTSPNSLQVKNRQATRSYSFSSFYFFPILFSFNSFINCTRHLVSPREKKVGFAEIDEETKLTFII